MDREQFTFYKSFYFGLARIRKGADRAKAYDTIVEYALFGKAPDLDALPDIVASAFELVKPNLDSSRKKSEAGRKGGASKQEANAKQMEATAKQEQEQEQVQVQGKEQMLYPPTSSSRKFSPPSVAEVEEYVREKGYHIDPEAFVAFYASKGWLVGNTPMKDWKAAAVTWEKREQEKKGAGSPSQPVTPNDTGDLDWIVEREQKKGTWKNWDEWEHGGSVEVEAST